MRYLRSLWLALCVALPVQAQARIDANTEVRSAPDGNVVAELMAGTTWPTGATRANWTALVIEGWVEASRFAGPRDSFPQSIGGTANQRIRSEGSLNGRILGQFRPGAGFTTLERQNNWARVRREVWVRSSAITQQAAAAPATTRPQPSSTSASAAATPPAETPAASAAPTPASPLGGALRTQAGAQMASAPQGTNVGELVPGTVVQPLGRDRGWVKVRVEAWVPESALAPADTAFGATISAADLRLDPEGNRGRIVRWTVQVVGLQTADPLRRDLEPDEPFLLAMGPKGEDAILYIAVPPQLLDQARDIPPLAEITLTARVRTGRSSPTGAPVLDLLSIISR